MTMKEHYEKLAQEQESGVKLTEAEASARKKEIALAAKNIVTAFVFTAQMLTTTLAGIKEHLENEHAECDKCMEIINAMCNEDVASE